jgi:hypothetical protein
MLSGKNVTRILSVAAIFAASAYVGLSTLSPESGETTPAHCADSHTRSTAAFPKALCAPEVERSSQENSVDRVASNTEIGSPDEAMPPADNTITRRRFNNPNRAAAEVPLTQQPQPGFTITEICATDSGDMHCRTGTYAAISEHSGAKRHDSPDTGGNISGRVMTTAGDGLPGLTIVASPERINTLGTSASETLRFWTVTDMFGAYTFQGLPEGEYTIRSSKAGKHQSARTSARTGVDYADLIVPHSDVLLASGQIVTPIGEPLEGVTVLPILPGQASVLSNDSGRFELPLVLKETARTFAIRFQRPGFNEAVVSVDYLRDVVDLSALDVVMEPVESWILVSGTVRSDSGSPLADRTVVLRPVDGQQSYRVKTERDGSFSFPGVESPSDYRLIVHGDARHKDFEQLVNVNPRLNPLDVVVDSWEFGKLTGQLRNANGVPVPNFDLVLRNAASRKPVAQLTTDQAGNFKVPAAPAGTLVISSQSTPHLLVQGLDVAAGKSQHVELTLDWGSHTISGTVTDSRGAPVPASQIILKWLSISNDGITSSATRRTAADLEGRFSFNSLGPGPHVVRVSAPGFVPVDMEHDLSRQGYEMNIRLDRSVSNRIDQDQLRNGAAVAATRRNSTTAWQETLVNSDTS